MKNDFRHLAACRPGSGVDPELFYPSAASGPVYQAQVAKAKAVCAGCPVRAECLDHALAQVPVGIAGGMTEDERRNHARRPRSDAPASELMPATRAEAVAMRPGDKRKVGLWLFDQGKGPTYIAAKLHVSDRTVSRWAAAREQAVTATG